jgi:hypothetical protein
VLIGDTGLEDTVPTGEGLVTFQDLAGAVTGVNAINDHYDAHCAQARRIAERHFGAELVLARFLEDALA